MSENYTPYYQFRPQCGQKYQDVHEPTTYYRCTSCDFQIYNNLNATASALIMRNDHQEILLVQRAYEPKKGYWDIAGGFCDPHEHPEETVHREVKEELGIEISVEKLWGIYAPTAYEFQNIVHQNCDIFYLAHITAGEPQPADDVAAYQWFPLSELPSLDSIAFSSAQKALPELQKAFLHA